MKPPGLNTGVVPADGRELKIRRPQAGPFQVQQRGQAPLVPQYVGEAGITVDHRAVLELGVAD